MKLEKTAHWLTIVGNLGLLIGIVLVLVQINQNSELMRHQLSMQRWGDDMNLQLVLMGENPASAIAKAIEEPAQLSIEEAQILEAYQLYWSRGYSGGSFCMTAEWMKFHRHPSSLAIQELNWL